MATEDEAREAADGTEVQVEAVDLGTVHLQAHPDVKLSSIIEIKKVGEIIDSTEGTLKVPEDQVLVEASSEVELPPEHKLNGKDSSLNGHMDKEKISNDQPLENDQEEAELDGTSAHQSNGIHKEKVTDSLSHGESITEDSNLLKHEKDEEPQGDGQIDLECVTVDDDSMQEDTLKTESAIEQTDDGQPDQNQEPEQENEDTQPASIANNANVEVVAEALSRPQTPVEPHLDDSGEVPGSIDEKPKPAEPAKEDCVVHLDHNPSLPEDTSIAEPTEEVVKVEDQQSQKDDMMDADVVQEEMLTCEKTDVQEEVPKSEHADEPPTDAHEVLNQESTKETDGPVDEKIEDTAHQSNMEVPEETATMEPPVNIHAQNQESLEEIEDAEAVNPEAAIQQRSIAFEEVIPEEQHDLGITVDGGTVQEDTLETIEKTEDVQQYQDVGLEKATEITQHESMANIPEVEVIAEAPSGVQTPVDISLDNSDGNIETDESAKADDDSHPDHKLGFSKDTSIAEPIEEVVKVEDQQNQQAVAMDEDVVKKEVPKSEQDDEPATGTQELLNQESTEETDGPVNEKIEETDGPVNDKIKETEHKSNMAPPEETTAEHDAQPRDTPVNIQMQNQESLEEIEDAEVEEPTCDSQEVDNAESTEETKGSIAESIVEVSDVVMVDNEVEEQNVLPTDDAAETHTPEPEPEETKNTEPVKTDEPSNHTNAVLFNDSSQGDNTPESEIQKAESATETTETETAPQESDACVSEDIATEDNSTIEPEADHKKLQDQESADFKEIEDDQPKEFASSSPISTSEQSTSKDNATEQNIQAEKSDTPEGTVGTEDVKSDTALAKVAVPEENIETDATVDMSPGREPELQETKDAEPAGTEDILTSDDLSAEKMDVETIETEVVPHESHVTSINELTEDGTEKVQEIEPVEDTQDTNTMEQPEEPHGSPSDELTPTEENPAVIEPAFDTQQVQNLKSQEIKDSKDAKTDKFSDLSSFPTPEEADQESKVQELGSTEITRDIESMGTEDHQEHGVSTIEDHSEPNVDDDQVHEGKVPEVKDNEAMEAGEVVQESKIDIPDDAAEETSELRSDPDCYVQPAQQVELCEDSENSQLVKAQEISGQINTVALEEIPTTEDSVASEIDPPVDIKQDHEQEPVEEIKGNDENEAEEQTHTSQIDAIEKPASEEITYAIKQDNEFEAAKKRNSIEAINDGEQTENATSEDSSPTENETAQEGHPAVLNEQTMGIETDNAMLVPGIKDELQTSLELQGYVTPSKEPSAEDDSTADEPHNNDFPQTLKDSVEVKDTISTTEEVTMEDNVTAEEPTCDSQEVDNAESTEETNGSIAENIVEVSDVVMVDNAAEEQHVLPTEDAAETHMPEPEPEETKNIESAETEEPSNQTNAILFNDSAQGDNAPESETQQAESATETTETETAPQESDACVSEEPGHRIESETNCDTQEVSITESLEAIDGDKDIITGAISGQNNMVSTRESAQISNVPKSDVQSEEQATEEIASEAQVLEPESIKEMNETETTEPQNISQDNIISISGESVPEDIATKDNSTVEPEANHKKLQDQESAEFKETEDDKPQEIASSSTLSTSEQSTSNDNATATEQNIQAENSEQAEGTEGTEHVRSDTALAEVAAPEENLETNATADMSPVQEPELQETKDAEAEPAGTEDIMISDDLLAEKMDMETMETEVVPHESHVTSTNELTEDGIEPVLELEPVEDTQGTNTMEHPGEPHGSSSDQPTPSEENPAVIEPSFDTQQVQNLTSQEIKDSEDVKKDQFSDISSFPTPEEADQERNLPRIEPSLDVQQVQKLDSTEETRDIESMGTESHQEHGVSTLEDHSEPNVDDEQVHEDKIPEVKDNEAMEAGEVVQQSNIDIPDDATEERSELRSDPDSYVQPAQQVELCEDSENSQLVKPQETSGQTNAAALDETPTEDSVASEIDPPVDLKQDHEQEPVDEIKGNDENEAEEVFHTSQIDAIEKPTSEDNIASIETTYDIKQENELEVAKEINSVEAINDGEQTENATLEDPSPTENETAQEGHPAVLNEQTMGVETKNAMLVPGIKDEIQTALEPQDDACDFGETVLTTQESENVTGEDAVRSPGDDILETSNSTDQAKEEKKDGCEHNSSETSGMQNEDNIINVQDRDISGELLTKIGTEDASQALFESDPQGAQEVTKKDDTIEGGEQTSDLNSQPGDVAFQLHTCEEDALSIGKQDEVVQKVDLDQQQKEDENIESQKEELQTDKQKHEDKGDDFTSEPLVESEGIENDPTYRTEDTNACEAEQTETVSKHEEAPHASEESTPISLAMQESTEKDDIVEKDYKDEQGEITGEITNEELEPDLASSGQEASDPAPSNDDILQSDPASITQNVESGEHIEDKECTDKVNDDVLAIQASEEEIADEIKENKEMQNEENAIHHNESETKPEEGEAPQLPSNEPCNVDAKTDDTTTLDEEIVPDNASINPRETEEIGENKGLDSASEPLVESSVQNNVEQDLNSHHKVDGEKLSMAEQNAVDIEAMQEKTDASVSDINQTKQYQEEINIDDVLQLKVEENSSGKIDQTVSHVKTETSTTDAVTINDNITDEGSGADGGPSDGSLQTFNTGRDLDVSSVITASKEENVNENMEDNKLSLPAQGENTLEQAPCLEKTEREMSSSEKFLPTESEDNQIPNESNEDESQDESQIPNEKNDEDMQDTDVGDAQKEAEQDLPVSHFLMNLILGKKNSDANENSESEAEGKQEETTEDDSCMIISKQDESLGSLPTENKVDDNLTFEPENHDVKCAEETKEMVKEEGDNVKLDTERSIQTDDEFNKNTRDLEIAAYHGNPQDNISGEPLSEEAASVSTKMETRDIEIPKFWVYDRVVDTVCQESTEASTKVENGSLKSCINDLTNTKASGEDTLGEGQIGLLHESLPGGKSADAVLEQTPLLTESGTTDAKDLSCDAESVQNLACAKEDEPNESSIIEVTSTPDTQLVCEEVEKKEEEQHGSMATDRISKEDLEGSNDNLQKSTSSEVKTDEQAPQIIEPVSNTEKILAQEEEISEASMEERENSNFSIKKVENSQTAVEIQDDDQNMKINQDKKDEIADSKTAMGPEIDTEQKPPEVTDEDQQLLVKKETMIKEQVVPGTVENQEQTMSIKSNEEQEVFDSKVQERDVNMISPREASDAEENFVDVKPEFSTDEEQSPKADAEEINYDQKTKEVEETKNYTNGAAMKTEAPGATQKTPKKLNLLSGVGSKVKHQLAKVKKAIVGKPGKTKPDSPKS